VAASEDAHRAAVTGANGYYSPASRVEHRASIGNLELAILGVAYEEDKEVFALRQVL
jgi:hypothetical protein